MAQIACGSIRQRSCMSMSPLPSGINEEALRKLMYCADKHLPCVYLPDVQRGLSCPMTFAGAMACSNAGQLVGLVISQLVSEGAPTILSTARPSLVDMKTMIMPYGTGDGRGGSIEINHYYNLPAFATGGATDSKLLDEQAIFEATLSLYGAMLSGGNMIHDMGYMESGLMGSLELVVIEDEIVSWITCGPGREFNEENLALDLIHEHALSADFLGTKHTVRHVREDYQPCLMDRQNYAKWVESGATSMRDRARVKIDEILGTEPQHILPPDIEKRISAIAERAVAAQAK